MPLKPFKVLKEAVVCQDHDRFTVVRATLQTPKEDTIEFSYLKTKDGVIIMGMDDEQNVYLKHEWRPGRKDFVWEVPSGFIEFENPTNEQILTTANRELQEEIGVKASSLQNLQTFYLANHITCKFHIILATNLQPSQLPHDEHEFVEVRKLPFQQAYDLVMNTQIPNAQTVIAFAMVKEHLHI